MAENHWKLRFELLESSLSEYAVFTLDGAGLITSWNPGVEQVLGYPREEFVGLAFAALFTPEDQAMQRPAEELARAAATGRSDDKRFHVRKDGSRFPADGVVRAMHHDPAAEPTPLQPGRVYQVTIGLGDICHTFRAGSRVEIDVTSSNFPRRARNTNSGNPMLAQDGDDAIRVATNTVHHAAAMPSFVELPVLAT